MGKKDKSTTAYDPENGKVRGELKFTVVLRDVERPDDDYRWQWDLAIYSESGHQVALADNFPLAQVVDELQRWAHDFLLPAALVAGLADGWEGHNLYEC